MKPNKDFFVECNEGAMMNPSDFEKTFCSQCKNRKCVRASWAFSSWDRRILTQVDRLLNNPNIVLQDSTSRWDGVSNFEEFKEPQVIETWNVQDITIEREEDDTVPAPPVPPEIEEEEGEDSVVTSAPKIEIPINTYTNPLNTPAQEIMIGEQPIPVQHSKPKNFRSDPWSVNETLPVGGKFKMGK